MPAQEYHKRITDYYAATENAYRDAWDLDRSLAIHYGYWDKKVNSFRQSLQRMNEVMAEAAQVKPGDVVLDAGCGVGGSSIFLAQVHQCKVIGITLSETQVKMAAEHAQQRGAGNNTHFLVKDYCDTGFPPQSFDVVWGCESICYAQDKEQFVREAYRLLKPGGRLVVADGFVTSLENNQHPIIRQWLDGWQVNYLETMDRFCGFMHQTGFVNIRFTDITQYTAHSSWRLYKYYHLASLYVWWKKIFSKSRTTLIQKKNILACKFQYHGMKKGLWQYGLLAGEKVK